MPLGSLAGPAAYALCQKACSVSLSAGAAGPPIYAACQSTCASLLLEPPYSIATGLVPQLDICWMKDQSNRQ